MQRMQDELAQRQMHQQTRQSFEVLLVSSWMDIDHYCVTKNWSTRRNPAQYTDHSEQFEGEEKSESES